MVLTGQAQITHQFLEESRKDARRSELLAAPLLLIVLLLVFRSGVAALLPLAIAAFVVALTFFACRVLSEFTYVHDNFLNLITILALGLAVDYCLFMVSRFRQELAAGWESHAAVVRTMQTAGVTVLFSTGAVAAALAATLVFPDHLNSMALVGLASVTAGLGAVIVLPAVLAVLGHNVDRLQLFPRRPAPARGGFWHGLAMVVMRHPVPVALGAAFVLILAGVPFFKVELTLPDERMLPAGVTSRQATEQIRQNFSSNDAFAISVVGPASGDPERLRAELSGYASTLSALPGVGHVDAFPGSFGRGRQLAPETPISRGRFSDEARRGTWLSVLPNPDVEPLGASGEDLVERVRSTPAPFPIKIGGQSAQLVDSKKAIFDRLPVVLGLIALMTLIILFLLFGSVLVPIKAIILNLLSLTATFGSMVWVFQQGHGAGLLNFTPPGGLDAFVMIVVFCVAFGMSMDYEVFLLSQIKEEHDLGSDNVRSVAMGLERTGRIVTAAAAAIAIVCVSLLTGRTLGVKLFGLGLCLAVLADATVIRGLLVPAVMRLAGNANWWAPQPLLRLRQRLGFGQQRLPPDLSGDLPLPIRDRDTAATTR